MGEGPGQGRNHSNTLGISEGQVSGGEGDVVDVL